jgi:hypothetical protein
MESAKRIVPTGQKNSIFSYVISITDEEESSTFFWKYLGGLSTHN